MTIDTHHHFWHYTAEEYGWIANAELRRDFLPEHLQPELTATKIDGVISVQARQTEAETEWLLSLAAKHSFIRGVVGWVPLVDPSVRETLARFSADPKFRGVRHVLQGEDDSYMLREDFNRGIAALEEFDLRYDVLIFEAQLPNAIALVDRHPNQIFILDHLAKPDFKTDLSSWRTRMKELARRTNVYCKLSGGVFEADVTTCNLETLRPVFDFALDAFTPARLMFGSNWPLTEVAGGLCHWTNLLRTWASQLSLGEQHQLFSAAATSAYGLA